MQNTVTIYKFVYRQCRYWTDKGTDGWNWYDNIALCIHVILTVIYLKNVSKSPSLVLITATKMHY